MKHDEIKGEIEILTPKSELNKMGGQGIGRMARDVRILHKESQIEISVGHFRSQHGNFELAILMLKTALESI